MNEQAKKTAAENRLDKFRKAVDLVVVGDPVALKSIKGPEGEVYHVKPRKFSKKNAARIRRLAIETATDLSPALQSKMRRIRREHKDEELKEEEIESLLTDEEMSELTKSSDPSSRYEVLHAKVLYGIAEHDFGGEWEPMTEEIADLALEAPEVAEELLELVDNLNPPFLKGTSDSSGT